jgi:CHAD domain-containing protein
MPAPAEIAKPETKRQRKAAKRARYAAELLPPVGGAKHTKRTKKHYKGIQSVLGDNQDTVVASTA